MTTVEFINERARSPRGMHDTSKSKFQIAEKRVGGVNHLAVLSFAKHDFISILGTNRICVVADLTEEVFPLLLRENLEGRIYRNIWLLTHSPGPRFPMRADQTTYKHHSVRQMHYMDDRILQQFWSAHLVAARKWYVHIWELLYKIRVVWKTNR